MLFSEGRKGLPGTETMSWIQAQEERDYDTQEEYRAVLRADHFDPYEFFTDCEEHGQAFDIRTGHCTACPVFEPKTPEEIMLEHWDAGDEPPF